MLSYNEIEISFTILRILLRTTKISKELRAKEKEEGSSLRFGRRGREEKKWRRCFPSYHLTVPSLLSPSQTVTSIQAQKYAHSRKTWKSPRHTKWHSANIARLFNRRAGVHARPRAPGLRKAYSNRSKKERERRCRRRVRTKRRRNGRGLAYFFFFSYLVYSFFF